MTDCQPNDDGTRCIICGWKKPAKIKGWPRRNCGKPGPSPTPPTTEDALRTAASSGDWPVPIDEALAQLERCKSCCQMRGICRLNQGSQTDCQQRRVWLRRLLSTGCRTED